MQQVPEEGLEIEPNPATGELKYYLRPHIYQDDIKVYSKDNVIYRDEVQPISESVDTNGKRVFTIYKRVYACFEELDPSLS